MASNSPWFKVRNIERFFLLLISLVMGLLFYQLYGVLQKDFEEVPARLANGTIMNLNDDKPGERIRLLLQKGFYYKDKRDADLISSVMARGLSETGEEIDNIGELNKNKYNINAEEAYEKGGQNFRRRVEISRTLVGFSDDDSTLFRQEKSKPIRVSAVSMLGMGNGRISGQISNREQQPVSGVLVRLRLVVPQDSVYSAAVSEVEDVAVEFKNGIRKLFALDSARNRQLQTFTAYARSDENGKFAFDGLLENKAYEVLPLQPAFQFGRSQGVTSLNRDVSFNFVHRPTPSNLYPQGISAT